VLVGDPVLVSPAGLPARIRSLHAQNRPAETAWAGDRCALNLTGPEISKEAVARGAIVLDPALHAPAERIDARLRLLKAEPKPIGQWFPARLHHATAELGARIVLLGDGPIAPGEIGDVQLVLDRPIAAAQQDRFVLRDVSGQRTIGGGRFLDLRAPARRRRTPERRTQLTALACPEPGAAFAALLQAPPYAWDLTSFARDRALSTAQAELLTQDAVLLDGQLAMAADRWQGFVTSLLDRLAAYHAENPDLQGLGRDKLRLELQPRLPAPAFLAALRRLAQLGEIALDGAFVRLAGHVARLSAADEAAWQAIEKLLGGTERFRPPRVRDIAGSTSMPEREVRRLLKLAGRMGWADEIAPDHFFLRATVREMIGILAELAPQGDITAAQFRDRVDNGRKVAIQILEFLDRHGVTLRKGDLRRLNGHRLDLFGTPVLSSAAEEGGDSSLVGRSDFKSEWGSEPVPGGFDSHSLPPN
jgi:selenocysteine-specific elongation factor